jgi:hypothetical protein
MLFGEWGSGKSRIDAIDAAARFALVKGAQFIVETGRKAGEHPESRDVPAEASISVYLAKLFT